MGQSRCRNEPSRRKDVLMSKTVSRRAFLTSAATATAGIAAASAFATSAFAAGGPGGGPGGPAKEVVYASAETTDDGRVKGYCGPGDWLGTKPEIAEDPGVFPDQELIDRCEVFNSLDADVEKLYTDAYNQILAAD